MRFVAVDVETHRFAPDGKVRTEPKDPPMVCMTWAMKTRGITGVVAHTTGCCPVAEPHGEVHREACHGMLERWLEDPKVTLVFHNSAFDCAVLAREFPGLRDSLRRKCFDLQILDTQTLHALLAPDWPYQRSLKRLAKEYLGVDMSKGPVRTSFRRGTVLTPEQIEYATQDAKVTLELALRLWQEELGGLSVVPEDWRLHTVACQRNRQVPDPRLMYSSAAALTGLGLETRGMEVDRERLSEHAAEAQATVDREMARLVNAGLAEWVRKPKARVEGHLPQPGEVLPNLTRHWQCGGDGFMYRWWRGGGERVPAVAKLCEAPLKTEYALFAEVRGIRYPVTPTGQLSLEYDFWKEYRDRLPESLKAHLALGKARKLLSTYFRPLQDAFKRQDRVRVYPSYGVGLTETARWSCWKPNFQNQPKSIRDMYKSGQLGYVLVGADYSTLELYTLCQVMASLGIKGELYDALSTADVHVTTAAMLLDKPAEKITKDERQYAKACNYSIPGGQGPKGFAAKVKRDYGLDWTVEKAREMKERWLEVYPDVAEYIQNFQINPLNLRHYSQTRSRFLESLGFDPSKWTSMWEIQEAMNRGKLFRCVLPSGRAVANRRYSQALNLFFQGTGADVITLAFLVAEERGLDVVAVVHDSLTVECPKEEAAPVAHDLEQAMEEAQRIICPLAPPPTVKAEVKEVWF